MSALLGVALGLGVGNLITVYVAWCHLEDRLDYIESKCDERWDRDHLKR